ncbi:ArsR/SmtB family transcription factor [Yinghuangia seranimata]|uniref:ArsR/SmtB family transcription factor n=1 Tax=Yinghuangia seranimata TaxID=408067 RepID=UPI00248BED98|nr:helix-turn-helix domain-containing protein [Yinghuangia seranimata]MDI2126505.1 helix-turn-helix domain-containing protein [Yinghuangia seranimata]
MVERDLFQPSTADIRLSDVLAAFADPVRLEVVRLIDGLGAGEDGDGTPCSQYGDMLGIHKSTVSHHLKVLREAGVTRTRVQGRNRLVQLRRADLDVRFPGLVDVVLNAAAEADAKAGAEAAAAS